MHEAQDGADGQRSPGPGPLGHTSHGLLQGGGRGHPGAAFSSSFACHLSVRAEVTHKRGEALWGLRREEGALGAQRPGHFRSGMYHLVDVRQVTFKGDGPLGGIQVVADARGNVKGKVGNPAADPPLRPDGKLNVGAAVGKGDLSLLSYHLPPGRAACLQAEPCSQGAPVHATPCPGPLHHQHVH